MKNGWKEKLIGEVLKLEYGKPLDEANRNLAGLYPVYGANGEKDRSNKFYFDKPSIIVGRKGSAGEVNLTEPKFWPLDVTYFVTFDDRQYDLRFLFYLLTTLELPRLAKGVKPGINRNEVYAQVVKVPPLPEQQRIVAILDEAFDDIATAKANAEKNLQNAHTLMRSALKSALSMHGPGWQRCTIGEQVMLQRGFDITKNQQRSGRVPVVSSGGVKSFHDTAMVHAPGVVIGRKGTLGKVFFLEDDFWPHDTTLWIKQFNGNHPRFVYYFFTNLDVIHLDSGAANPALNRNQVHPIEVDWPPVSQQKVIAEKLDVVAVETQRLASIYRQKLAALDELKKSLLHKAFSGELTEQPRRSVVIPFPARIPGITTTDLHAGVLAIAFQLHKERGNLKHFGHVKAEKIAHMVEAHLGIDLDRTPVKDAAGPNDYPHLKRVEHRARKAGFFDFQRVEGSGYQVTKYRQFQSLIERTREKLGKRGRDVDSLLELMLPMDTQQAEIFCTVYAAWNNLLLDRQQPTDESIVLEAREKWHPNKLSIPREKFFAAIELLRKKGVTPAGRGKKVTAKARKR